MIIVRKCRGEKNEIPLEDGVRRGGRGRTKAKKAKQHAIRIEKKSMSQGDKAHTSDGRSLHCHSVLISASSFRHLKSMNSKRATVRDKTRVNLAWHVPDIEFK